MQKRRIVVIIITVVVFVFVSALFAYLRNINIGNKEDSHNDSLNKKRYEVLEKALRESDLFMNSKLIFNEETEIVKIDDKYDVYLKSGSYMMTIRDKKLENNYCEIVDAIEQSLGHEKGASIETCKETLNGKVSMGHIKADIYDDYKVLSVNSEEAATLYKVTQTHKENEFISVDEINYNIKIGDYLLTSMSTNFTNEVKLYNVCGHIYNDKKGTDEFLISTYDMNKTKLEEQILKYENNTLKYISFCLDFPLETDIVKYYSVARMVSEND